MFFTIVDIPDIMKNLGWRYGKQLMDTWFFRPAAVAPNYSKPVTDIIKMDWVLSFKRARKVFNELVAERIWTNLPARNRILDVLRAKGGYFDQFPGSVPFGDLTQPVPLLDADYINFRAIGGDNYDYYDYGFDLDDLTASLGAFPFRVAVAGMVTPAAARGSAGHDVTINQVGVYIRDSYDFQGRQSLGWWGTPNRVSAFPNMNDDWVTNGDFRDWRSISGKGGDYMIFSDLKQLDVEEFTFNTWDRKPVAAP